MQFAKKLAILLLLTLGAGHFSLANAEPVTKTESVTKGTGCPIFSIQGL